MSRIPVVAAVLYRDGKIYATQRGYGPQKDGWEFPGGKVEIGETPEEAIIREIREELGVEIIPLEKLAEVDQDYPNISIHLVCFWSRILEGEPTLTEHEAAKWIGLSELENVEWLPADRMVIEAVRDKMQNNKN
ncbi:MAG: (deoxy)nucleoside triphosphate pyrophosphohydrolase [Oscillospiraceae bacterium]|nr:(deoxy)nucleoside triphosphate pyrophosphohydrolase [Oscillospiraceae bacterium]